MTDRKVWKLTIYNHWKHDFINQQARKKCLTKLNDLDVVQTVIQKGYSMRLYILPKHFFH